MPKKKPEKRQRRKESRRALASRWQILNDQPEDVDRLVGKLQLNRECAIMLPRRQDLLENEAMGGKDLQIKVRVLGWGAERGAGRGESAGYPHAARTRREGGGGEVGGRGLQENSGTMSKRMRTSS